jgi:hypothetical protein
MEPKRTKFRLEELESRETPSTLTVTPPSTHVPTPPAPITATIAAQGCTHGISVAATHTSVVSCS